MKGEAEMEKTLIRNAKLQDAEDILGIYAYYVENTAMTFEYDVPALEEFQNRMKKIMGKYPYLVLEQDGKIAGYAYAGAIRRILSSAAERQGSRRSGNVFFCKNVSKMDPCFSYMKQYER